MFKLNIIVNNEFPWVLGTSQSQFILNLGKSVLNIFQTIFYKFVVFKESL